MSGHAASPAGAGSRRRRRAAIAAAAALVALASAAAYLAFRSSSRRLPAARNIVLITLDTLRSDRLSCYGSRLVDTPNIDGFAAEGVRFTNAASPVPLTLPAHASIMTGLYPPGHGVRENVGYVLDERIPTLAELLAKGGWATGGFVSAFVLDHQWGIGRGFDRYFDDFDLQGVETAGAANMGSVQRDGADTVAAAVRWLDERPAGRPFFLWLHLYDPHEPYTPREPFGSRFPGRPYDGEVAYTDSLVGDFRGALERRGLLEDALVVITSDHGEGLGDHGEEFHGFFVYDTTVHAALIVRLPERAAGGRVVAGAVSHVDLLPTILDLAGLAVPERVHGRSLTPLLAGRGADWSRPVYSESLYALLHYGWAPLRAIRTDRFKLIDAPRAELYDLAEDPSELTNLHGLEPNRVQALATALADLRRGIDSGGLPGAPKPDLDEQTLAKLRSLGYVAGHGDAGIAEEEDRPRDDPKDRLVLHQKIMEAQSRIGHRENDVARRLLEEVVAEDEAVLDAHSMLGQIAEEQGLAEEAIRRYRRALELSPEHERSLFGLATSYAALGRFEDALAGFRRILDLKGADARSSLAIADVYVAMRRFDDAAAVLEQASAQGESSPYFLNKLGEVLAEQGRADEAISAFRRAIPPADDFPLPHFNLGALHERRGDVRAAVEHYERAITLEPRFFKAQFNLGRICAASGDLARARQLWEACLVSNPDFVQGHFYLAKLLMDGGDLARAETLARKGIALDTGRAEGPLGYYVLADVLNRTGRPAEARAAMTRGRAIQAESR